MSDYESKTPFGKDVYFANGGSNHHTASQNREMTEWQDREIQRLTDENNAMQEQLRWLPYATPVTAYRGESNE